MADGGLPSYSDVQAAQRARLELKQNFVTLTNDQLDIQELFRSVAAQLESTPEIGEQHPLSTEWNELRQRHRKVYRDSQQNAGLCAHFLKNFAEILVPLSQSTRVSLAQKRQMIGKFLEAIPVHLNAARENGERFSELGKDVEVFPRKVASALRLKAEPQGFFESVWTGIEELCMSIWNSLNRLLTKIVDMFKLMLSRLEKMRFSCFGISLDIHFSRYQSLDSDANMHEMTPRQVVGQLEEDTKAIVEKLTAFESAWHVVWLACSRLRSDLALARSFACGEPPIPQACNSNLCAGALLHTPLVECLNAYSLGKSPDFA
ncbi:hypothetical protein PYCCODRAFT_1431206 [Trametes coccinea BRFM310]|uniref:Uncharacterized protein n=1 Tax=Trametes coccinea (strain BRFM310) TaxID=1353009 RepID=A0A1Y2J0V2_TRAC3|nr:hypothetical protein PYCCODRAFT_1431206 [Trametes coccinea BRFM310]